jgi:hypothetical protein
MPIEPAAALPVLPTELEGASLELASATPKLIKPPKPVVHKLPKAPVKVAKPRVHLAKPHVIAKISKPRAAAAAALLPAALVAPKIKGAAAKATSAASLLRGPSANSLKTMIQREAVHVTGGVIQRAITNGVTAKEKAAFAPKPKAAPAPAAPQSAQTAQPADPAQPAAAPAAK